MTVIRTLGILVTFALLAGCANDVSTVAGDNRTMRARVETVSTQKVPKLLEARGTIHAEHDATLASRAMGPVVREHVKIGDVVRKGDVLIEIEETMSGGGLAQAKGALAQAHAALTLAERNYRRYESLYAKKACSELELDLARMQYEQSRGAVEQAQGAVDAAGAVAGESSLRAPFDAVVVDKLVSVGDLVAPGRPLIHLQSSNGREIHFTVRAGDRSFVQKGALIPFTIESQPEQSAQIARITEVSPSADPVTHSFAVKATIERHSLPAGLTAQVTLSGDTVELIAIPRSALYDAGGLTLVSVVDENGIAHTKAVTAGKPYGELIEVLSGLRAGESIVVERSGVIAEGTRIERVNE